MDDRFMYQIHPRKPIVNLIPGKGIRKPMGIKLTKEEVKKCIAYGPVYRSFPSIPPIRVTGSNLDSLHVTEEEYLNRDKKEAVPSNSTENAVEEPKHEVNIPEDPKTELLTEEKAEEKQEEEPIIVPVEPGPVIIEEKDPEKKIEEMKTKEVVFDSEAIPVEENLSEAEDEIEPTEQIAVGVVEPQEVSEDLVEDEEIEDEDEEEEGDDTEVIAPVAPNGSLQPQAPHKKKKKRH